MLKKQIKIIKPQKNSNEIDSNIASFFRKLINWVSKNPTFAVSGLLILFAIIGFLYDTVFYEKFGINISDFTKPEDFIFGWLRDKPLIMFFAFLIFLPLFTSLAVIIVDELRKDQVNYRLIQFLFQINMFLFLILFVIRAIILQKIAIDYFNLILVTAIIFFFFGMDDITNIWRGEYFHKKRTEKIKFRPIRNWSYDKEFYRRMKVFLLFKSIFALILMLFTIGATLNKEAERIHDNIIKTENNKYKVIFRSNPVDTLKIIGNNSIYYFFYSMKNKQVFIYPSNEIKAIKKIN